MRENLIPKIFFFEIQSNRNTECITRIKPETRSTKPETQNNCYEKPDSTRNPNVQTRPETR